MFSFINLAIWVTSIAETLAENPFAEFSKYFCPSRGGSSEGRSFFEQEAKMRQADAGDEREFFRPLTDAALE
jgi:hypothetical protein